MTALYTNLTGTAISSASLTGTAINDTDISGTAIVSAALSGSSISISALTGSSVVTVALLGYADGVANCRLTTQTVAAGDTLYTCPSPWIPEGETVTVEVTGLIDVPVA